MAERSGCPINLATEALGDRWSMVLLRDIIFGNQRTFRAILDNSLEGIATNILAARLKMLLAEEFLTAASDPSHKQRTIYSLTEKSIALVPALIALGAWGRAFLPTTPELSAPNKVLAEGGQQLQEVFMDELRERHLGQLFVHEGPRPSTLLQEAYEAARADAVKFGVRGEAEKR
ncbi:helix-turn-helix domain-containing protein [uncultured Ruegeria sp.]|uniref:winged helix-turn-helix transcriptional regulator n=1 Tax=uncultured Ruegeria sp. TaxID=259304 RepID=UPI00262A7E94|nr:helix-turn-helix domain-containing protein [uncultured Ruegeria sp.]